MTHTKLLMTINLGAASIKILEICSSETKNGLREGIRMNYAPYLGAIRGERVRAAARSIGAALIDQPVLEAYRCSREEKLRDGIKGPDFRFGVHETRAEQPWDEHPFHRKANGSWRGAGGDRAAPCSDVPAAETERRRTWGWVSCGHLRWDLIGSMSSVRTHLSPKNQLDPTSGAGLESQSGTQRATGALT